MEKKAIKKSVVSAIAVLLMLAMCSCGNGQNTDAEITHTSGETGLYKAEKDGEKTVVDMTGHVQTGYELDDDGNITENGQIVVSKHDVQEYRYVKAMVSLMESPEVHVKLEEQKAEKQEEYEIKPAYIEYRMYVSPAEAFNPELEATSSDTETAELCGEDGSGGKMAKIMPEEGIATLRIKCKKPGTSIISVSTTDNSGQSFEITLKAELKEDETQSDNNAKDVIETVQNAAGWTKADGSGIVWLYEKPDAASTRLNVYRTGREVLVTGKTGDWYRCSAGACTGYVKQENISFIKPAEEASIRAEGSTATSSGTAGEKAAENDGKDHGNAAGAEHEEKLEKGTETAENHIHCYEKKTVVPSTADSPGYVIYSCSCGACCRSACR